MTVIPVKPSSREGKRHTFLNPLVEGEQADVFKKFSSGGRYRRCDELFFSLFQYHVKCLQNLINGLMKIAALRVSFFGIQMIP